MGNPRRDMVIIARVRRPHGIRGQLPVEDLTGWAFSPEQGSEPSFDLKTGPKTIKLAKIKEVPRGHIYSLEGYTRREQVDAFRGVYIEIEKTELPKTEDDEYYYFDLIGLPVYDVSGSRVGEVIAVSDMAGGVLEIETESGELLVPFAKKHIREIETGLVCFCDALVEVMTCSCNLSLRS